ncbi:MAG: M50 family metallopeptidase [Patescibacteria group bacterium]|nr:M50 family metallopeptidase [Patescibacteria group bacterium]
MSIGISIITISILGYFSNFLNNKYLNYKIIRILYFLGAFIHESSHAIMCIFTGAKIEKIHIFSSQPKVVHRQSKIPIIGQMLISFAPIAGGFLFIFLINKFILGNIITINSASKWKEIFKTSFNLISQINLFSWQGIVFILLLLNSGAMMGPSFQDIKNTWFALLILLFIKWNFINSLGIIIICLVLANILIQVPIIIILKIFKR